MQSVEIVITSEQSNTGVGIGVLLTGTGVATYVPLCPECGHHIIYKNSWAPDMICTNGFCDKYFTEFPGIPHSMLRHGGLWSQAYNYSLVLYPSDKALIEWIDRWTNLPVYIEHL